MSRRRGERDWDRKIFEEIMTKMFKFGEKSKCIDQETQQTPNRMNLKKTMPRYTCIRTTGHQQKKRKP